MQPLVVKNFTLLGSIALPDVIIWSYLKSEEDGTMTFQDRLHRLRRERGLSQEGLAEIVGVTRQAVQKWESGASRPDMDNLTALARYFGVSLDYLITGTESPSGPAAPPQVQTVVNNYYHRWEYEYKSQRTLWGLPLVHIHLQDNGFVRAKGIIAIGNVATGLVSAGVISVGLVSLGVISLGLLVSIGCVAAGLLAAGGLAAGAVAAGGFAFGWLALAGAGRDLLWNLRRRRHCFGIGNRGGRCCPSASGGGGGHGGSPDHYPCSGRGRHAGEAGRHQGGNRRRPGRALPLAGDISQRTAIKKGLLFCSPFFHLRTLPVIGWLTII